MQVLSLSELSVCDDSTDRSSLLAQITHLQAQLSQLQQDTHTNQQLPHTLGMTGTTPRPTHTHIHLGFRGNITATLSKIRDFRETDRRERQRDGGV